ncbi:MAG: hypothetical protein ACLUW4_07640 [Butyribacter sp.]
MIKTLKEMSRRKKRG